MKDCDKVHSGNIKFKILNIKMLEFYVSIINRHNLLIT